MGPRVRGDDSGDSVATGISSGRTGSSLGNFPAPETSTAEEDVHMADKQSPPAGPDLALGVSPDDFKNDMLLGHVGKEDVLLARVGSDIFAIDAYCRHYHGP